MCRASRRSCPVSRMDRMNPVRQVYRFTQQILEYWNISSRVQYLTVTIVPSSSSTPHSRRSHHTRGIPPTHPLLHQATTLYISTLLPTSSHPQGSHQPSPPSLLPPQSQPITTPRLNLSPKQPPNPAPAHHSQRPPTLPPFQKHWKNNTTTLHDLTASQPLSLTASPGTVVARK